MKTFTRFSVILFAIFFVFALRTFSQNFNNHPTIRLQCGNTATPDKYDETELVFIQDTTPFCLMKYSCSKLLNTDTMYPNIYVVYNNKPYSVKALPENGKGDTLIHLAVKPGSSGTYFITVNSYENFDDSTKLYLNDPDDSITYEARYGTTLVFDVEKGEPVENLFMKYVPSRSAVTGIKNVTKRTSKFSTFVNNKELFLSYYNSNENEGILHAYSMTGSEIMQPVSIHNGTFRLAFDKPAGVYVMKIMTNEETIVRKVVAR